VRAAVYDRLGPAREVLRVVDLDRPEPAQGEVRVRVRASAVNPTDYKARAATPGKSMPFPYVIPHQDGAGEIDAVGEGVDPARLGERVWMYFAGFRRPHGTAAQWVCLPERQAVALPEAVGFDLGASLGIPALTAHRAVFSDGPVTGQTILVAGGAGAVGHFAIELARHAGAQVIATASSPQKAALAEAAGADPVVDYRDQDAAAAVRKAAPDGVDRIVEVALGANLQLDLAVLARSGTIVTYGADGPDPHIPVRDLMVANVILRFLLIYGVPEPALQQAIADVTTALANGALTELPAHRYGLDEIAAAHEAAEAGAIGKVLIDMEPGAFP
jgi:NADPH2:quinone reductase